MPTCLRCTTGADHEAAECKFTGFGIPGADQPHGCPLEIRPRVIHLLSRHEQADARTLLVRGKQRGYEFELMHLLAGNDPAAVDALAGLVLDESLAAVTVEGEGIGDVEGQRRWAEAVSHHHGSQVG